MAKTLALSGACGEKQTGYFRIGPHQNTTEDRAKFKRADQEQDQNRRLPVRILYGNVFRKSRHFRRLRRGCVVFVARRPRSEGQIGTSSVANLGYRFSNFRFR